MEIDASVIEQMVRRAIAEKAGSATAGASVSMGGDYGVFDTMNGAIEASVVAQQELLHSTMEQRQKYVDVIRETVLNRQNLEVMSRLAVVSTSLSRTLLLLRRLQEQRILLLRQLQATMV